MTYNLVEIQKRQESTDKFVQKVKEKRDLVWQRNECE